MALWRLQAGAPFARHLLQVVGSRASSLNTRLRESRGAITSNEGFSLVAPIQGHSAVLAPWGRMASCWSLWKRGFIVDEEVAVSEARPALKILARPPPSGSRTTPAVTATFATRRAFGLRRQDGPRGFVLPPSGAGPSSTTLWGGVLAGSAPSATSTIRLWPCTSFDLKLLGRRRGRSAGRLVQRPSELESIPLSRTAEVIHGTLCYKSRRGLLGHCTLRACRLGPRTAPPRSQPSDKSRVRCTGGP